MFDEIAIPNTNLTVQVFHGQKQTKLVLRNLAPNDRHPITKPFEFLEALPEQTREQITTAVGRSLWEKV